MTEATGGGSPQLSWRERETIGLSHMWRPSTEGMPGTVQCDPDAPGHHPGDPGKTWEGGPDLHRRGGKTDRSQVLLPHPDSD